MFGNTGSEESRRQHTAKAAGIYTYIPTYMYMYSTHQAEQPQTKRRTVSMHIHLQPHSLPFPRFHEQTYSSRVPAAKTGTKDCDMGNVKRKVIQCANTKTAGDR